MVLGEIPSQEDITYASIVITFAKKGYSEEQAKEIANVMVEKYQVTPIRIKDENDGY